MRHGVPAPDEARAQGLRIGDPHDGNLGRLFNPESVPGGRMVAETAGAGRRTPEEPGTPAV